MAFILKVKLTRLRVNALTRIVTRVTFVVVGYEYVKHSQVRFQTYSGNHSCLVKMPWVCYRSLIQVFNGIVTQVVPWL